MLPTGVQHDDLGVPEPHPKALCMLSLDHAIPLAVELGNQISSCYISSRQECSPWIIPGVTELVVPAPLQQRCCLLCIVCKPVFSVLRTQRGKAVPTCILQKHINHPRNKDNAGGRVRYLCEHSPKRNVMAGSGLDESVASASKLPPEQAIPELRDVILGKHPNDADSIKAKEQVGCAAVDGLVYWLWTADLQSRCKNLQHFHAPAEMGHAMTADHMKPSSPTQKAFPSGRKFCVLCRLFSASATFT